MGLWGDGGAAAALTIGRGDGWKWGGKKEGPWVDTKKEGIKGDALQILAKNNQD